MNMNMNMNINMNKKIYTKERILYGNWEKRVYEQQVRDRQDNSKIGNISTIRLNLINHTLALFHAKFAYNSACRNPIFRWE